MAKAKQEIDPDAQADPRVKDVVLANRRREAADKELIHQAYGCRLWLMEREGKITKAEREAGDSYCSLVEAYKNAMYGQDPDDMEKHNKIKERYNESQKLLKMGDISILRAVEDVCLREVAAITYTDIQRVKHGLSRLELLFGVGTKRQHS